MKKLLCAALCALMLLLSVSAGAEMYEALTVEDPYYAFTAPDGTRTVTDLKGLSLLAEAALHEGETPTVSARALLQAMEEDALKVLLRMDGTETLARFNNMNGVLHLTDNTLPGGGFAVMDLLRGAGLNMTKLGPQTVALRDGEHTGTTYLVSGADETEAMLMLTVLEDKAFLAQPLGNAKYGIPDFTLLWNVAKDGTGYAECTVNDTTYRYDGCMDETYPDRLRGSLSCLDTEGNMDSETYACFAPEEREDGVYTVACASGSAWSAYAEFGGGHFFASAALADGSVWTARMAEEQFAFAAEKDGSRDFIRANASYAYSADVSLLPVPDFSGLPVITADDAQFADVGLGLKAKLMRIDALQPLLRAWGLDDNNDQ